MTEIKLPPLPNPFTTVYDDVDKVEVGCYTETQVRAAIEADRKLRDRAVVAWLHQCRKKPELKTVSFSKDEPKLKAIGYKSIPLYSTPQPKQLTGPALVAYLRDNPTSEAMRAAADEIERLREAAELSLGHVKAASLDYAPDANLDTAEELLAAALAQGEA